MTDTDEDIIRQLTIRLQETVIENDRLREENERLRAEGGAAAALRDVYLNPNSSEGNKVKAAAASLPFERPKLMPERAPLELTAEPDEDLATIVQRQRMRARAIQALPLEERERMIAGVVRRDGNGDDSGSND